MHRRAMHSAPDLGLVLAQTLFQRNARMRLSPFRVNSLAIPRDVDFPGR